MTAWPPPGAKPVPLDGFYAALADTGYQYGPVFQGLKAAWRADGAWYAEVSLPEDQHKDAARYGLHPALLDAALHAQLTAPAGRRGAPPGSACRSPGAGCACTRPEPRACGYGSNPRARAVSPCASPTPRATPSPPSTPSSPGPSPPTACAAPPPRPPLAPCTGSPGAPSRAPRPHPG
ncbi:polyketide synthase dehydratase domain-containing protein [Streptomyces kaempferi]